MKLDIWTMIHALASAICGACGKLHECARALEQWVWRRESAAQLDEINSRVVRR